MQVKPYGLKTKWRSLFREVSDEESAVKRTRELSARFFFLPFLATPEDKVYIQGQI